MKKSKVIMAVGVTALSVCAFVATKANKFFTGQTSARVNFSTPFTITGLPAAHFTNTAIAGHTALMKTASGGLIGTLLTTTLKTNKVYFH